MHLQIIRKPSTSNLNSIGQFWKYPTTRKILYCGSSIFYLSKHSWILQYCKFVVYPWRLHNAYPFLEMNITCSRLIVQLKKNNFFLYTYITSERCVYFTRSCEIPLIIKRWQLVYTPVFDWSVFWLLCSFYVVL